MKSLVSCGVGFDPPPGELGDRMTTELIDKSADPGLGCLLNDRVASGSRLRVAKRNQPNHSLMGRIPPILRANRMRRA